MSDDAEEAALRAPSRMAALVAERDAALTRAEDAERRGRNAMLAVKGLARMLNETQAALREACELADEGWEYAGDYFRGKWDSAGRIAELRKLAEDA